MLAHLLDPGATHRQGTRFLTGFLNVLQQAAEMQGKLLQLPLPEARTRYKWRCRREVPLPDGQADIVLRGPGLLLIIENKIYASDREDQLWRYWQYAKNEKNVLPVIVYLTPDGRRPTTNSVRGDRELSQKLVLLSYHRDISRFIEETLTDLQAVSVAEVLRQYLAAAQSL